MIERSAEGRVRAGILGLALAGALAVGCVGSQQLDAAGNTRSVREAIARLESADDVSVTVDTERALHVSLVNATEPGGGRAEAERRSRRIAIAAFLAYPARASLEAVVVTTAKSRSDSDARGADSRRFRPIDLLRPSDVSEHWVRRAPSARRLYLVAVGDEPAGVIGPLSRHFQDSLGISIQELPAMRLPAGAFDSARSQVVAEEAIAAMARSYPAVADDAQARVIGITGQDMYLREMRWAFGFSLRSEDGQMAVVSYARMDPEALGLSPDAEMLSRRVAKMVAKNIGVLCFGLPLSNNPRSAMYGNVGGTDELDVMTEFFDPR